MEPMLTSAIVVLSTALYTFAVKVLPEKKATKLTKIVTILSDILIVLAKSPPGIKKLFKF